MFGYRSGYGEVVEMTCERCFPLPAFDIQHAKHVRKFLETCEGKIGILCCLQWRVRQGTKSFERRRLSLGFDSDVIDITDIYL
jgi:hypothetical protein